MSFLKKVVIGEDDDAIAHLIEATLGDAGFLCLRGRNGEEALLLARAEAPDLLILDVLMPRMDGIQVVRKLKADPVHSGVPVLMLTALSSTEDKVRGLEAGADDYLAKPFDLRELLARARALIRQTRRERDRSTTTSLPGHDTFDAHLRDRRASGEPCVVVLIDLDHFGQLLDQVGWRRAEEVLAAYGQALSTAAREVPSALLCHVGGDDFGMLIEPDQEADLIEAVRRAAADARQLLGESTPRLRLLCLGEAGDGLEECLRLAAPRLRAGEGTLV